MPIAPDEAIDRIQAGDKDAFWHLVSLYRNRAFGLCFSIVGNIEDAKDILQEAFIKVYKNIKNFRRGSQFYTWFYAIVVNTARDHLRTNIRRQTVALKDTADLRRGAERGVINDELKSALAAAVSRLSEKQRLTFVMKHVNGMKIDEIAGILRCRPSTVKVHLFRAVRNLQKMLGPYAAPDGQGGKHAML